VNPFESMADHCYVKKTMQPNKTLQLTPSRIAPVSYDRSAFPFTSFQSLVPRSGQLSLAMDRL
jgi:hypothetical protein